MLTRKPQHPFLSPDPVCRVFSLDHARAEKQRFFAGERDTNRERRHPARMLASVDWTTLAVIAFACGWNLLALIGLGTLVVRLLERVNAWGWL